MKLQHIHYENFRNHRSLIFDPAEGINLVYGPNGSGKTSLLEGIHYCALTKGFVSSTDSESLQFGSDFFRVEGTFLSEAESTTTVRVMYKKEREKQVMVNNCDVKPFSAHIGRLPCITFSAPELVIVTGAPAERRRFLDSAISQTNRSYLHDLLAYRRVLEQRNALLFQLQTGHSAQRAMLSLWSEQLAQLGASLVAARLHFLSHFAEQLQKLYQDLSVQEVPALLYRSSSGKLNDESSVASLAPFFLQKYSETENMEIARGTTLSGPHRDDLLFLLNDREVKKYASQGQLRTFLIALKLAQYRLCSDMLGLQPICLLDDMFSELDHSRSTDILAILETFGQTIITAVDKRGGSNVASFSMETLKTARE